MSYPWSRGRPRPRRGGTRDPDVSRTATVTSSIRNMQRSVTRRLSHLRKLPRCEQWPAAHRRGRARGWGGPPLPRPHAQTRRPARPDRAGRANRAAPRRRCRARQRDRTGDRGPRRTDHHHLAEHGRRRRQPGLGGGPDHVAVLWPRGGRAPERMGRGRRARRPAVRHAGVVACRRQPPRDVPIAVATYATVRRHATRPPGPAARRHVAAARPDPAPGAAPSTTTAPRADAPSTRSGR